jgi:hypothetical protein
LSERVVHCCHDHGNGSRQTKPRQDAPVKVIFPIGVAGNVELPHGEILHDPFVFRRKLLIVAEPLALLLRHVPTDADRRGRGGVGRIVVVAIVPLLLLHNGRSSKLKARSRALHTGLCLCLCLWIQQAFEVERMEIVDGGAEGQGGRRRRRRANVVSGGSTSIVARSRRCGCSCSTSLQSIRRVGSAHRRSGSRLLAFLAPKTIGDGRASSGSRVAWVLGACHADQVEFWRDDKADSAHIAR